MEIDKVKNIFRHTYLGRRKAERERCGAFLASGVDGGAFKGIFQRGSGSFEGDSHGTGA